MFLVSSLSKLLQSYNLDEEYQETPVDDSDVPKHQLVEQLHPPEKELDNQICLPTTVENSSESSEPLDISQELDNFFAEVDTIIPLATSEQNTEPVPIVASDSIEPSNLESKNETPDQQQDTPVLSLDTISSSPSADAMNESSVTYSNEPQAAIPEPPPPPPMEDASPDLNVASSLPERLVENDRRRDSTALRLQLADEASEPLHKLVHIAAEVLSIPSLLSIICTSHADLFSWLQVAYVQLTTRVEDLRAGALDADYFAQCLSESRVRLGEFEAHFLPASLAAAELDPTLPCAWRAAWEPSAKRYAYSNLTTGESVWQHPVVIAAAAAKAKQAANASSTKHSSSSHRRRERTARTSSRRSRSRTKSRSRSRSRSRSQSKSKSKSRTKSKSGKSTSRHAHKTSHRKRRRLSREASRQHDRKRRRRSRSRSRHKSIRRRRDRSLSTSSSASSSDSSVAIEKPITTKLEAKRSSSRSSSSSPPPSPKAKTLAPPNDAPVVTESPNGTREASGASPASDRPRQLVSYAADGDTSADSDMDASAIEDELEKRLDSKEDKSTLMEESLAAQSSAISSTQPDPIPNEDAAATAAAPSAEVAKSSSSSGAVVVSKPPTLFPSAVASVAPTAATAAAPPSDDPMQAFYSELASVDTEFSSDTAQPVAAPPPPARSSAALPAASAASAAASVPAAKRVTNDSVPTAAANAASSTETQSTKATTANQKAATHTSATSGASSRSSTESKKSAAALAPPSVRNVALNAAASNPPSGSFGNKKDMAQLVAKWQRARAELDK